MYNQNLNYPNLNQQPPYSGYVYNNPTNTNANQYNQYNQNLQPNLNQNSSPIVNNNSLPSNNNTQNQPNNNAPSQSNGAVMNTISANMHHGGHQRLHQGQYFIKDLDKTLQGKARQGFVKKVYTLLTIQLIITILIGYWAYNSDLFKAIFINIPVLIILSVLLIGLSCFMGCCSEVFRKIALPIFIIFTLLFALLVGISICFYKSKIIFMAAALTLLLVAALTAYACIAKSDLTGCGPFLLIFSLIMIAFGITCIFWRDPIVQLIYACLAALLFGIYLIFDTQLVLGRGEYSYSLDDAYFASIQLYIDIIQLFLQILQILSYFDN